MKRISEYAAFEYEEVDKMLVSELVDYLDVNVKKVYEFFDISCNQNKPVIRIIPTKKEFDNCFKFAWDFEADNSSRGFYKNGVITYLSIHDYKNTTHAFEKDYYLGALDDYKKTLVHEFVHYVNELFNVINNCGPTIKFLREGIAIYLSGQKENKSIKLSNSLEDLLDVNKNYYDEYYLLTKYLITNYDKRFVFELFKSNRKAKEFLKEELYEKVKE